MTELTYRHPDSGEVMTQQQMLVEMIGQQPRFRVMGIPPADAKVKITEEMRKRVEAYPAGTLADTRNPIKPVCPIADTQKAEQERAERDAAIYRRFQTGRVQRAAGALLTHADSSPYARG